jgi:hypothetical protein
MSVHFSELTEDLCGFDLTYDWYCDKPAIPNSKLCHAHSLVKCYKEENCKGIMSLCPETHSFVCGLHRCSIHGCRNFRCS